MIITHLFHLYFEQTSQESSLSEIDPDFQDIEKKLHRNIHQSKKTKSFFSPILNNKVEKISLIVETDNFDFYQNKKLDIDSSNIDKFLGDEDKILPSLKNGVEVTYRGEIVTLQSNRGESLTVHISELDEYFSSFVVYPPEGQKTDAYVNYYKKECELNLEVRRKSLYQKPKFILKDIDILQKSLFTSSQ